MNDRQVVSLILATAINTKDFKIAKVYQNIIVPKNGVIYIEFSHPEPKICTKEISYSSLTESWPIQSEFREQFFTA